MLGKALTEGAKMKGAGLHRMEASGNSKDQEIG